MDAWRIYYSSSFTEAEAATTANVDNDDQALLERLAKREERRQKRMKEAMERQKELDPTVGGADSTESAMEEQPINSTSENQQQAEQEVVETDQRASKKDEEDKEDDKNVK